MGAAASTKSKAPDSDRNKTSARYRHGADSGRISTNSGSSVRRMALMNHARQENSYIPQEALNATFLKKSLRISGDTSRLNKPPAPILEAVVVDNKVTTEADDLITAEQKQNSELPTEAPKFGFNVFKGNAFNLKINIEDDVDWVQVGNFVTDFL